MRGPRARTIKGSPSNLRKAVWIESIILFLAILFLTFFSFLPASVFVSLSIPFFLSLGAGVIVDDEQEREKQRALEAYRREEELRRKELAIAQAKQQAAKPKQTSPQPTQSPPKKGRFVADYFFPAQVSRASTNPASDSDKDLEKKILEDLKKEKVKQKILEKEEQEGGLLGFVTSVFGGSDKEAEAVVPGMCAVSENLELFLLLMR